MPRSWQRTVDCRGVGGGGGGVECFKTTIVHKRSHVVQFHCHEISRVGASKETESRLVITGVWGRRVWGVNCLLGIGSLLGVMKMFLNYVEVMAAQHYEWTQCH